MRTKVFSPVFVLMFFLSSCQTKIPIGLDVTPSPVVTQTLASIPTVTLIVPEPLSTPIPYPTASQVNANAIAFIDEAEDGKTLSLWVVNLDGSGERKLVKNLDDTKWGSHGYATLRWSPNGKWISYLSSEELWIVSSDGLVNKKVLSFPNDGRGTVYNYQWSPDSSQIAYIQAGLAAGLESDVPIVVGLLDLGTGNILELSSYKSPTPVTFSWSPNGHYLLLSKMGTRGLSIFDIAARKFVKEIESTPNCPPWHRGVSWSPNSNWFYDIPSTNGRFATTQICVAGLDGSHRQIDINGTATSYPVWDKTGNFLYFVVSNTNFSITPIPDYDLRLMRYDVRTQKLTRILSLGKDPRGWAVSASSDGNTLLLQSASSSTKLDLVFVNLRSLVTTKQSIDFGSEPYPQVEPYTQIKPYSILDDFTRLITYDWSPDNKNIIFFFTKAHAVNTVWSFPGYGFFYALDIRTGKITVFSGIHRAENVQISPIAAIP